MKKAGIGIYGSNGHQISPDMINQEKAYIAGVCDYSMEKLPSGVPVYDKLEDMLKDDNIKLVSICSRRRRNQAEDIIKVLRSGRHVYAEKPCVMDIAQLDYIINLAQKRNLIFCEMVNTAFDRPYNKAREIVESGMLGRIVQVFAQKSYPYADWRPQDEDIDGGLIMQCAIYGMRFVEHIAGQKITSVQAFETSLGNPAANGALKMAAAMNMQLEGGGIATVIANYLNQPSTKIWGNEEVRIFGVNGFLRTNIYNKTVEVFTKDGMSVYESTEQESIFDILIDCIYNEKPFPISIYELTNPARMAILAKISATEGITIDI